MASHARPGWQDARSELPSAVICFSIVLYTEHDNLCSFAQAMHGDLNFSVPVEAIG